MRLLQNPGSVAAVSDRRLSLPAFTAVRDRRYRVLQKPQMELETVKVAKA
jgi:hypothetical protein